MSRAKMLRWTAVATAGSLVLAVTVGAAWSLTMTKTTTTRRPLTGVSACEDSQGDSTIEQQQLSTQPKRRPGQTPPEYYQEYGSLPPPSVPHGVLSQTKLTDDGPPRGRGLLIVGDVHGCYEELMELHRKAVQLNDNTPLEHVILVGDLVNKGPQSVAVLKHCRMTPGWHTVRGNHDNAGLLAACGDPQRVQRPKYAWVQELTPDDVEWMAELPYSLRIPSSVLASTNRDDAMPAETYDILVVHAGLEPDVPLEQQTVETMTKLRNVKDQAWAATHQGPWHVVFGHDAKRGLQQMPYATGLDTGCVYGKQLTGLLFLPGSQQQLVSVPSKSAYAPIGVPQ